ncbi:imidazoleglycerol-phosphate dehydratase HisB [Spirochaeta isovalerica]|uniref:Imidazoleglycerol-phosphate dehydratase n=1 Tax=Spirochaeta isovalerica TaxID=150 RepID=A0A841RCY3_9SPIO|nr:imidazoleglycerol-phosphate dehydratase HisB [Spirochaeta isovalerica]MBB6480252.1 imidazoleglycerol-phosphate dehydratase [Spirochaeta isovalerica]
MPVEIKRETAETKIFLKLDLESRNKPAISTGLPFFDHMLYAMAFHGKFFLELKADGDVDVDPHHLVEDTGLVLGQAFLKSFRDKGAINRYGQAKIPMDDALSEVVIDVCNRPYLVYNVSYPQEMSGNFANYLFKEFFQAFVSEAKINLHLLSHYGENSHHISESLFKAMGIALEYAFRKTGASGTESMSTKGVI